MKKKLILLTGNELRHKYFACILSANKNIDLKLVVHESNIKLKKNILYKQDKLIKKHIDLRHKTEINDFKKYVNLNKNYKSINIKNKSINDEKIINLIKLIEFDYIISYGCSIISTKFINKFKKKIYNIHLGLSPYYKGSGTNFFPFVNKELQFCGSTIMQISKKLDGGKIIHQVRPNFGINDGIHTLGNKIIKKTANELCKIITEKKKFKFFKIKTNYKTRVYKRKDFTRGTLELALKNIKNNLIPNYINKYKVIMEKKYPIKSQI
jgi:folate-dependent phosphoribosylglycinamide formyltransferase PurN